MWTSRGSNSLPSQAAFPTHLCCRGRPDLSLHFPIPCLCKCVCTVAIFYKKTKTSLWVCVCLHHHGGEGCRGARAEGSGHRHFSSRHLGRKAACVSPAETGPVPLRCGDTANMGREYAKGPPAPLVRKGCTCVFWGAVTCSTCTWDLSSCWERPVCHLLLLGGNYTTLPAGLRPTHHPSAPQSFTTITPPPGTHGQKAWSPGPFIPASASLPVRPACPQLQQGEHGMRFIVLPLDAKNTAYPNTGFH